MRPVNSLWVLYTKNLALWALKTLVFLFKSGLAFYEIFQFFFVLMNEVFANYSSYLKVLQFFSREFNFWSLILKRIIFFELSVAKVKTFFNLRQMSLTAIVS
jgi:hypothetical protein